MEEKTTVVIDIQLDDQGVADRLAQVNREMSGLKATNQQLRKDVRDGNKTWEEVSATLAENEAKLKTLKAEQSALSGQVAQATAKNREYGTSLKEQSALLNDLRNRYQSLSEAQRNSAGGKEMLKQIQDLDAKMKSADGSIGLFQRNVGDYANQIAKISGLFGSAGGAASSLTGKLGMVTKGLGAMAATPVIAVITALVAIIQKAAAAMKGSEEQTMRWRETMAVFEPLLNAVKNGLSAFSAILIDTVQVAIKGVTAAVNGLAKAADWVGRVFGADWGLSRKTEELKAQAAAQRELTKAENEYIMQKRAWGIESAKIDRDVADLRAKAVDKENYTNQQRLAFLQQALDKETERATKEKEMAEENLRLLRIRAAQTENDAEMNDKLAAAEIAVIQADTRLAESQRAMTREMNRLHSEIRSEGVAARNAYKKSIEESRKAGMETLELAREMGEALKLLKPEDERELDFFEQLEKHYAEIDEKAKEAAKQHELLRRHILDTQGVDIDAKLDDSIMDKLGRQSNAWYNFTQTYKENAETIQETSQALSSSFGSVASMYEAMANDESKSEEERAKAAQAAKRWSALQIAANAGTAVAKGVASAMDTPFPANIGAIATTLAAILAAIAQAKALAAEGHAQGGVVGGYTGATMGPDNTVINARKGEMVLNANQQRQLFDIANGGSMGSSLTASLVAALQAMPAPVLEYSEFARFQGRLVNLNESQKLK